MVRIYTMMLAALLFMPLLPTEAKVSMQSFDVVGHRGARDIRPENTVPAFAYAMETGVSAIELDVHLSADGKVVVAHDPFLSYTMARQPDGKWVPKDKPLDIRMMKLAEIEKYYVGDINPANVQYFALHGTTQVRFPKAHVPTLAEVFALMKNYNADKVEVNLEIKSCPDEKRHDYVNSPDPETIVRKVLAVIDEYKMRDRVRILAFDWRMLKVFHDVAPDVTLVALIEEDTAKEGSPWLAGLKLSDFNGDPMAAAKKIGADVYSPYFGMLSKEGIENAHKLGLKVEAWTVDTVPDMMHMIEMGVDGITTDRPETLREVLQYKGIVVPASVQRQKGIADYANNPDIDS